MRENGALLFDTRIVGFADQRPEGAQVFDARGGYVSAGLVDVHCHGFGGREAGDVDADGRDEAAFAAALRAATVLPPVERARLVAAARQRAAGFTWEASAEKLWYVLKQVARSLND